jgi:cell division protein FtsQ
LTPENRRVHPVACPLDAERNGPVLAPPEAVPTRWSRLVSAIRTGFGIALVVGGSLVVAGLARRHVTSSPRFAVTSVQVVGNERRSGDSIIAESGLAVGVNVFSVDLDSARASILADPWIAEVTLARRLPGTILVQVTERKPAALVAIGETFLAAADGEPFKRFEPGDPVDLPLITGLTPESLTEDREGARRTIRRGIDLAAEYDHGALAHRAPLEEVHVDAEGAFTLVVGHSAMSLVLGGPPFRHKLDEAARVLTELDKRHARADSIMLDNDIHPERVVVRLRQ